MASHVVIAAGGGVIPPLQKFVLLLVADGQEVGSAQAPVQMAACATFEPADRDIPVTTAYYNLVVYNFVVHTCVF